MAINLSTLLYEVFPTVTLDASGEELYTEKTVTKAVGSMVLTLWLFDNWVLFRALVPVDRAGTENQRFCFGCAFSFSYLRFFALYKKKWLFPKVKDMVFIIIIIEKFLEYHKLMHN